MSTRTAAAIWERFDRMEARLAAPVSARMIALAGLRPGQRVLDLATGRGEPAIPAAHAVGPRGQVVGTDPEAGVLALAQARANEEGLENLSFFPTEAESLAGVPAGPYDAVLARWGLMYMRDPISALRAARDRLAEGGVVVAALWGAPEDVAWYALPRAVLAPYRAIPPVDFTVPGIFRYASADVVTADFASAGYVIEHREDLSVDVLETDDEAFLIDWCRTFGLGKLLEGLPEATQAAWERALVAKVRETSRDGVLRLGGITPLVVARRRPSFP